MHLESRLEQDLLFVDIVNPPVNCLSFGIRRDLYTTFTVSALDPKVSGIVLGGSGKYFCAGGDLREMGTALASAEPRLSADLLPAIERCPKPIIAAIHGGAIGGGFELALACHYRVALVNARIALPEIQHGIIPLSGTIRLPRLWGIDRALAMILDSTALLAEDFRGSAVFDCLVPCLESTPDAQRATLHNAVLKFAQHVVCADRNLANPADRLVRNRPRADNAAPDAFDAALTRYAPQSFNLAQIAAVAAVRAGVESSDFDAALREAQRLYDGLVDSLPPR